jgi:hypothetical protein
MIGLPLTPDGTLVQRGYKPKNRVGRRCLRGTAEVRINWDVPDIKEPFWDVESVPILQAPYVKFVR